MTNKHPIRSIEIWDKMVEFDRVGLGSIIYRPSDALMAHLEEVLARRMGVEGIRARKLTIYLRSGGANVCFNPQPTPDELEKEGE